MPSALARYFSEFRVVRHLSRDFWLANLIQFFDGLAYFSMINVITLYLTVNVGFNDVDSGAWVGIFTLYITAFLFAVGSICDAIGIKRSYYIAIAILATSRLGLGLAPEFLHGETLQMAVKGLIILMALGQSFIVPVTYTALRRFTGRETRATAFNIYYLIMNLGAMLAGIVVIDGFRRAYGDVFGNLAILDFGFTMSLCTLACVLFIREDNWADSSDREAAAGEVKRPLAIFLDVWREAEFRKLVLFLLLTLGVRLVFTHQFLVAPKYYTRVLYSDFSLGAINSINPFLIVIGLIVIIPLVNRFATIKLIVIGMAISAASLLFMAVPLEWILALPGIHNVTQAYLFIILAQIVVFAVGELLFSPRFTEYVASIAPPDKVSSYMALSALPLFIAKPVNGYVSGLLISNYCYDGIRAKIDTGNIAYAHSPEFMWMIYLIPAALSPILVLTCRRFIMARPVSARTVAEPAVPVVEGEAV